jgi:uncharacterized membrane protein YfcA
MLFGFDFSLLAITSLAVFLVGLSKGGLGGVAILGVPLMALFISPVQAAAILLPILVVMDMVGLLTWRGEWDRKTLLMIIPPAVLGVGIGWITASHVSEAAVRLIVGVLAGLFVLRSLPWPGAREKAARGHRPVMAWILGTIAGYTSFVAHAGGPPFQIYALPLKMDPRRYTATSVLFFTIVNAVKLGPYFALGQFDTTNLTLSALMFPLAIVSTWLGAWVVKRMKPAVFYPMIHAFIGLVAVKLIWDGVMGLV